MLGSNVGEGDGEGKNGLHEGNGSPHKSTLLANAAAGNFANPVGIEPLRWLLATLKSTSLGGTLLGIFPVNPLFSRKRPVKLVRLPTENGIEPVKLLDERSSRVSRPMSATLAGKSPVNTLFWR